MVWVVNGEHLLALGPPCILAGALPWDRHLLSWQSQLKPAEGSNARLGAGATPPTHVSCEEGGSHQLQGCHIPSQVLCCLWEESDQAVPATTATLCCPTFLCVDIALPTGHVLKHMDATGVQTGTGRCVRNAGLKRPMSVQRDTSVLIYRFLNNIQGLDVTQTL